MGEVATVRTPVIIANEINSIKDQTRTMILCNSIEIGRRLHEAKLLVDHGEWGDWLKSSIDYSKSTANNLMRIYDEYGSDQVALFGDNSKSQALGSLSYTQAVALLGVPDKEEFIKENDVENMSTRELQEAIKAQKAAEKKASDAEQRNKDLLKHSQEIKAKSDEVYENFKKLNEEHFQTKLDIKRLNGLLEMAKSNGDSSEKIKQLEDELEAAQDQVQELTDKINEPVTMEPVVIKEVPEEIEQELAELREKNKDLEAQASKQSPEIIKFVVYFDSLKTGFQGLLGSLAEIKEVDMEKYEKYKNAVNGLLDKMSEKLL